MADFTFDHTTGPAPTEMEAFFGAVLLGKPVVSFGNACDTATALAWLEARRVAYSDALGGRSAIIKNMDLANRVILDPAGVTDGVVP